MTLGWRDERERLVPRRARHTFVIGLMSVIARGQRESSVVSGASGAERRFADSHPLRLFPTLVWRVELADPIRARVNASVLKAVEELRGSLPPLKRRDHE
jgi:hypothetical protein